MIWRACLLVILLPSLAACTRPPSTNAPATPSVSIPTAPPSATLTAPPSFILPPSSLVLPPSSLLPPTPPPDLTALTPENASAVAQLAEIHFPSTGLVTALAWSPDGQWLAVAAGENLALLNPTSPPLTPNSLYRIGSFTNSLAFSPDGLWLAAGSRDGMLRVWNFTALLAAGNAGAPPVLALQAHKKGVNSLAFSPDGRTLATGGNDAVARFWDLATGEILGVMIGGTFAVPSIAFAPDGKSLAVVNGKMIRLREVGSERIIGSFLADAPLFSVAFSPDGRLLAAGNNDNLVLLWDPAQAYRTGQEHYPEPLRLVGHQGKSGNYRALIWRVVFSPDGRLLASAGGDGAVRLWDPVSGALLVTLAEHRLGATCVAFRPDGRVLATGGLDRVVRLWGVGG